MPCNANCTCLPGPTGTFCGWIDRQDGIVHPCDPSCCNPLCQVSPPAMIGEYKQTRGVELPPGFGFELQTSERATSFPLEAPFEPVSLTKEPPYHRRLFWMIFLILVMVLMALLLAG